MPTSTVASTTQSATASQKALPKIMVEYIETNQLAKFMRTDSDAVIQIDPFVESTQLVNGGLEFVSTFRAQLSDTAVEGEDQPIKGNEEDITLYNDKLTAAKIAKPVKITNYVESQKRTIANLKSEVRDALRDWLARNLYLGVLTALKATDGRTQARTLYGSSDSNWNATEATARATVDTTNDRMSTAIISKLKQKALLQGSFKMRPANVSQKKGVICRNYQLIITDAAYDDLENDTKWQNKNKYITRDEGRVAHEGCQYKGTYDGVDVHVLYEDSLYLRGEGASSGDIAYCFFLGAQAVKVGYAERTGIKDEDDDYGTQKNSAIIEYRGQKKNVFNSEDIAVITAYVAVDAPAAI